MSLQQYNSLMSNLLREKHTLAKLKEELEERRGKLCRSCKEFRHLAQNCRKEKKKKRKTIPQNKFEILSSRVMQCEVEERIIRRQKEVAVECFTPVLVSLAGITSVYISFYFLCYFWPPVVPCNQLCHFPSSPMSSYWSVMMQVYYFPSQFLL